MATASLTRRRFSADEYHQMAEAGILHEDDRIELIDGEIVEMSAVGFRHIESVNQFTLWLSRHIEDDQLRVSVQNPVRLDDGTEPQPDLAVLRRRRARGLRDQYGPGDIVLLIEVADGSLAYDRQVKLPRYARAGIPEIWLADLLGYRLERHTDPGDGVYRSVSRAGSGEALESRALPGLVFDVDDGLGS